MARFAGPPCTCICSVCSLPVSKITRRADVETSCRPTRCTLQITVDQLQQAYSRYTIKTILFRGAYVCVCVCVCVFGVILVLYFIWNSVPEHARSAANRHCFSVASRLWYP